MISWSKCRPLKSPSIFVCARQLCRSTDLPTTMLCPSGSHQSPAQQGRDDPLGSYDFTWIWKELGLGDERR
jgi:hypothetical protein